MRAGYDSRADALQILLSDVNAREHSEPVDERCSVDLDASGSPAGIEILAAGDGGFEGGLAAMANRYGLDASALLAAARAALAVPDRPVVIDVGYLAA